MSGREASPLSDQAPAVPTIVGLGSANSVGGRPGSRPGSRVGGVPQGSPRPSSRLGPPSGSPRHNPPPREENVVQTHKPFEEKHDSGEDEPENKNETLVEARLGSRRGVQPQPLESNLIQPAGKLDSGASTAPPEAEPSAAPASRVGSAAPGSRVGSASPASRVGSASPNASRLQSRMGTGSPRAMSPRAMSPRGVVVAQSRDREAPAVVGGKKAPPKQGLFDRILGRRTRDDGADGEKDVGVLGGGDVQEKNAEGVTFIQEDTSKKDGSEGEKPDMKYERQALSTKVSQAPVGYQGDLPRHTELGSKSPWESLLRTIHREFDMSSLTSCLSPQLDEDVPWNPQMLLVHLTSSLRDAAENAPKGLGGLDLASGMHRELRLGKLFGGEVRKRRERAVPGSELKDDTEPPKQASPGPDSPAGRSRQVKLEAVKLEAEIAPAGKLGLKPHLQQDYLNEKVPRVKVETGSPLKAGSPRPGAQRGVINPRHHPRAQPKQVEEADASPPEEG